MRKLFAILVASALLAALSIVPASAEYIVDYTTTHTFASEADLGDLAPEGNVTVSDNAAVIAAGGYMLKTFAASAYSAMEIRMTVSAGTTTVRLGKTSSSSFNFEITPTTYKVGTDKISNGSYQRTILSGEHTGEVVISYIIDKENNKAVFTVNGDEYLLDAVVTESSAVPLVGATQLNNSFTNWEGFGIFAVGGSASISSIKVGRLTTEKTGSHNVGLTVHNTYRTVYSVDFSFGNFAFTYIPEDGETPARWEGNDGTNNVIAVTNRSNAPVQIDVTPTMNAELNGVTFQWDGALSTVLASAYGLDTPETYAVTATIGGTPDNSYVADGVTANVIGNVKVVVLGL